MVAFSDLSCILEGLFSCLYVSKLLPSYLLLVQNVQSMEHIMLCPVT